MTTAAFRPGYWDDEGYWVKHHYEPDHEDTDPDELYVTDLSQNQDDFALVAHRTTADAILGYHKQADLLNWLQETMSGRWLDELPKHRTQRTDFPNPARLPYKLLLHELTDNRLTNPDYAEALDAELKRRTEIGDYNSVPDEEDEERLVAAARQLLAAVLQLNETAPWFDPDISKFLKKDIVLDAPGNRDEWDFTASPETQYHHRAGPWLSEDDFDVDAMYARLRRGEPLYAQ